MSGRTVVAAAGAEVPAAGAGERVLVHDAALPERLLPTIAIFIAPPAVAMLSWSALTGDAGAPVARILWAAAMAFTLVLSAQVGRLRAIPLALPYLAYTFPLAAATAASIAMAGARPQSAYDAVAVVLLAATTALVLHVLVMTARVVSRRQICVPE